MRFRQLIWKELWQRPVPLLTSSLAIVLGVAAFVAIRGISASSEAAVSKDLGNLGANVLILPKDVSLNDYYAADLTGQTLPEEHAMALAFAGLTGVERISPRYCISTEVAGKQVVVSGILPQADFQQKAAWGAGMAIADPHAGCKRKVSMQEPNTPETVADQRAVQSLREDEVLLGADVATRSQLTKGDSIKLFGQNFKVAMVLPATGTVDDGRVFAHLHEVQRLTKAGEVVNAIEITACCEDAAGGLIQKLGEMFPDARVVTIHQIVQAQVSIQRTLKQVSGIVFLILIVLGGAAIASAMFANVSERRREVGTLMALGATPGFVTRLFLAKAALLGIAGGLLGGLLGTLAAGYLGPMLASVSVAPMPELIGLAVLIALAVAMFGSLIPAWRAAKLDPCICFKEI